MLLLVLAAGLADTFKRLLCCAVVPSLAKVTDADDAAKLLLIIDHGQSPDLCFAHSRGNIIDVIIDARCNDVVRH